MAHAASIARALSTWMTLTPAGSGSDTEDTMVFYSTQSPVARGISIAYCNLFDERNTGRYGPYVTEVLPDYTKYVTSDYVEAAMK